MKIGVLTSGGDAPGMNAAIRAVVRQSDALGHETWGIYRGYQGLLEGDLAPLTSRACANILQRGGSPTAMDRIWGSRWGAEVVRRLDRGEGGFYVGEVAGALVAQPLSRISEPQPVPPDDLSRLVAVLAR